MLQAEVLSFDSSSAEGSAAPGVAPVIIIIISGEGVVLAIKVPTIGTAKHHNQIHIL
jgi:hypothetical protein